MATNHDEDETEICPFCPPSGPPVFRPPGPSQTTGPSDDLHPSSDDDNDVDGPDLKWIACHKCDKWYHTVCVLQLSPESAQSVPQPLRDEAEASDLGVWFDWSSRADRWYCKPCIDYSTSTDNPKPPRRPLQATMKKPRGKGRRASGGDASSHTPKRARVSTPAAESPAGDEVQPVAAAPAETNTRPKRRAALDRPDYYNMHNQIATPTKDWIDLIKNPAKYGRKIKKDNFPRLPGRLLRKEWIESASAPGSLTPEESQALSKFPPTLFYGSSSEPMVVRPEDGGLESMGGMVPDPSLTVDDVAALVSPTRMVDVIDVATQSSSQWPLQQWADYVKARSDPNTPGPSKVYNIISLEISGTELAKQVRPPKLVSDVDWVENFWHFPKGKDATMSAAVKAAEGVVEPAVANGNDPAASAPAAKGKVKNDFPKVQLYCLMGMKNAWTDWHIDFAASSVYYSVHTGSKTFFFIRPTESNLAAYSQWSGSHELQASTWLPDMCDEVRSVTLVAGDTMIIPSGYIHAVFTPVDSIVFGGNFVHSYDIPTQLRLRQIEIDTKVPQRFRFPYFDKLCWYVAERFTSDLRQFRAYRPNAKPHAGKAPHERVLRGLVVLAHFLMEQTRVMEDPKTEEKERRLIWGRIPTQVQDPGALAHELLWRAEQELPESLEDEEEVKVKPEGGKGRGRKKANNKPNGAKPASRQSSVVPRSMHLLGCPPLSYTWSYWPSPWEQEDHPTSHSTESVMRVRPGGDGDPEPCELVTTIHHQSRKRLREAGGESVLEEQDVVYTEKRVKWGHRVEGMDATASVAGNGVKSEGVASSA